MASLGRKILASGNGRCNLLNDNLDESCYNESARPIVRSVFSRYGKKELYDFFRGLGLEMFSEEGRVFPATNQSSSVLKVLEMELARLSVKTELNFTVESAHHSRGKFVVKSKSGGGYECDKLIIASGGRSYPALGSDGSGYRLAEKFGHKVIGTVPVAVPLVIKDRLCHLLQGQKISARVRAVIDGKDACSAEGDLLFTKYGLSGTAILDISSDISIAMNRNGCKSVSVSVDMVPFMEREALEKELTKRMGGRPASPETIVGILPNKFGAALREEFASKKPAQIAALLKGRVFKVTETKSWNQADFTAGGVDLGGIDWRTLESKIVKGLYFAGEILDVCGERGGYNLAWAWASGLTAGGSAASGAGGTV
jgi:predicted Rossmann fold flavoprotein